MHCKFFAGYGALAECMYESTLDFIPRTDDRVFLNKREYYVEWVRWHMEDNFVWITIRAFD